MSSSLYDMTSDFQKFIEYLDTCEEGEELTEQLKEAVENLKEDIKEKIDNYAKVIKNKQFANAARETEIKRLQAAKKTDEKSIEYLKSIMKLAMEATIEPDKDGKFKLKTPFCSYWIQKNPKKVVMDCQDLDLVPEKYLVPQDPTINRELLLKDLEDEELLPSLDGIAHIEQSEGVRFR